MAAKRINYLAILGSVGLVLHVPGVMCLFTLIISWVFGELYAIIPFAITGIVSIALAQVLFWLCYDSESCHLWDAMITAALSWLVCPLVSAIPFYLTLLNYSQTAEPLATVLAFHTPLNVIFESFSGFTGTGLTLVENPEFFPNTILWWRSFMQWIGGIGLIVFMLSFVQTTRKSYTFYYAEARSEKLTRTVGQTSRLIWGIYLTYTLIGVLLLWLSGAPIWESINHAMTAISTGGFTIVNSSFSENSYKTQLTAMLLMFLGAVSFSMHYEVIRSTSLRPFWRDLEHRWFLVVLLIGPLCIYFLDFIGLQNFLFLNSAFEWFSALATCGFTSIDIASLNPAPKIFLILAMLVGGCVGSTAGGLKFQRCVSLMQSIASRFKLVFSREEEKDIENFGEASPNAETPELLEPYSERTERLYGSSVLFSLWMVTVVIGWVVILLASSHLAPINALFEVISAMSNVGLSAGGVSPDISAISKVAYIAMMWVGRLEIVPAIILFLAIPFTKKGS